MTNEVKEKLKTLPTKSGVYIMHGDGGNVIYVGKAKNLKNRVSSYFIAGKKTAKVQAMVDKVKWFEYIITPSELDAFTLENNLIKKHQPFYNILLKDSKTFPYIKINLKENYPHFQVTRKVLKDNCKYFGPFLAGVSANYLLNFINKHFKLRSCTSKLLKPQKRECINFEMGLCLAPCTQRVTQAKYYEQIEKAMDFLKGNDKAVLKELEEKMQKLSMSENFEEAIKVRQQYNMVKKIGNQSIANLPKSVDKDVLFYENNNLTGAIALIVVRGGRILAVRTYSSADPNNLESEILENFMINYYSQAIIPHEIILNHKINEDIICEMLGKNVHFITNPKGANLKLLKMAEENAKEHIEKYITKDRQKYDNTLGALKVLQEKLGLKHLPRRMECYDISNISGTNKVSSMVVFENGEPKKKDYRKFKIKTVQGIDDFASLRETLTRRLTRYKNQDGESFSSKPDLLIIDGGKGQLSSCFEILQKMGLSDQIEMVSLAKRLEEVFLPNNPVPVVLDHSTAALKLLQRIRDEAHRFAITFHRELRGKSMLVSELDKINGIGPKKRRLLTEAFENIEQIKNATPEELAVVKGIDIKLAHTIYAHFHKDNQKT